MKFKEENKKLENKLKKALIYLKKRWNSTPITKGTLRAMLLNAKNLGFNRAVVFAKKKQNKYKKNALLVYRKHPLRMLKPNNIFDVEGRLYSMYLMLPDEDPPEDVDFKPNSDCFYSNEEEVPLEELKELDKRIVRIIKNLESSPLDKPTVIPKVPPGENNMYFLNIENDEKFNLATPVNFVTPGAYESTYKSAGWHGTIGGAQIEPVDPHSACYYQIMCCGGKPAPDARVVIKNFMKKRNYYYFNYGSVGIINPISFVSGSQTISSSSSPPVIKEPVDPVPGPGRYPIPNLRIPGFEISIPNKTPNPQKKKSLITGSRGGLTRLTGSSISSIKSFEINTMGYNKYSGNRVISGGKKNARKRARTSSYNRGAWYNNGGFLGKNSSLKSSVGTPKFRLSDDISLGLNGTNDVPFIQIDPGVTRTGLGLAKERISYFKDSKNVLKAYGYYFTDPILLPFSDVDFGAVATNQYDDNIFFYPYNLKFGRDTYIDFFVKFKGNGTKVDVGSQTDFYFAIIGQADSSLPAFVDTFGVVGVPQSLAIGDDANNVITEIRMQHEIIAPNNGLFSVQIQCINGVGGVISPPINVISPPISSVISGHPVHVKLRLRTSNLGSPLGTVNLDSDFIINRERFSPGVFNAPVGVDNVSTLNKLAFGYIDYENLGLTTPSLSGRPIPLSCGANLTGLQLSRRPLSRVYVWDYTKLNKI